MTRLIDADALAPIPIEMRSDGREKWVVPYRDIYEAPTVDAIPVKWLKENFPTNGVYGTESYFRKAHAVQEVLGLWETEKEKRKEE